MKSMNLKRFASIVLAMVMALSLTVPAFASGTTEIQGTYTPIELNVVVPDSGTAIINPYGLPYNLSTDVAVSGQQITTGAPLVIQNKSVVALDVKAEVTGTASTGVTLTDGTKDVSGTATAIDFETETDKMLHVVFQAFPAAGVTGENVTDKETLLPKFAGLKDEDAVLEADVRLAADAGPAVGGDGSLVLKQADADKALQDGGAAFIRLSGEAAQAASWTEADTFTATIAFTFKPSTFAESAGTLLVESSTDGTTYAALADGANLDLGNGLGRVTLTPALPSGVTAAATDVVWTSDHAGVTVTKDAANPYRAALVSPTTIAPAESVTLTVTITGSDGNTYAASTTIMVISV